MRAIAIAALFCFSAAALAEDKKPTGNWSKKAEQFELKFSFQKNDVMVFTMDNGNDGCTMKSKCVFDKDGVVRCEVTDFEKKGNFPVTKEKGYKFSFKIEVKDKKAKVSHFEGDEIHEEAKSLLEGDYEKVAD